MTKLVIAERFRSPPGLNAVPANSKEKGPEVRLTLQDCEWLFKSALFWLLSAVLIPLRQSIT
jgi:hypothetical protein